MHLRGESELAFLGSKQFRGLHDPRVRSERSVERAHPMAWFIGSVTGQVYGEYQAGFKGAPDGVVHRIGDGPVVLPEGP